MGYNFKSLVHCYKAMELWMVKMASNEGIQYILRRGSTSNFIRLPITLTVLWMPVGP